MWVYGLDWAGPGYRQVADACECGNEPSGSVKCTSLYCTSLPSALDNFSFHLVLFTSLDSVSLHISKGNSGSVTERNVGV